MSENMQKVKLGDVCDILNGYAFKSDKYSSSGTRIIRITNVKNGYLEDNQPVYYPSESEEVNKFLLQTGDLLISLTGNVGRVAQINEDFLPAALNQRVGCLRIRNEYTDDVRIDYLFNILNDFNFENACCEAAKGVAQKNLSTDWLKNYEIFIPPIDMQNTICKTFNDVDILIYNRKKQLEKLDELIKSKFTEMFSDNLAERKGWQILSLSEIAQVGSSKRVFSEEFQNNGVPFYRGTEIGQLATGDFIENKLFITEERYKQLVKESGKAIIGDLLLPSICPDGRIWLVNTEKPFYFKDGRVLWISKIDKNVNSCYLQFALKEALSSNYSSIASGTTFAELKIFSLKNIDIVIPPIDVQLKFVKFKEKVEFIESEVKQSLAQLEMLKKSLMQKYFG